jgi:hypothetical protein
MLERLINSTFPSVPFLKRDYQRSQLNFTRLSPSSAPIDDFGNPALQPSVSIIEARLFRVAEGDRWVIENPSQSIKGEVYRGFCLNPKAISTWATIGSPGTAVVNAIAGQFTLLAIEPTSMPGYSQAFGEIIRIDFVRHTKFV